MHNSSGESLFFFCFFFYIRFVFLFSYKQISKCFLLNVFSLLFFFLTFYFLFLFLFLFAIFAFFLRWWRERFFFSLITSVRSICFEVLLLFIYFNASDLNLTIWTICTMTILQDNKSWIDQQNFVTNFSAALYSWRICLDNIVTRTKSRVDQSAQG